MCENGVGCSRMMMRLCLLNPAVRDGVQSEPDCQRCVANFNSVQDHANVDCSKLDVRRFIDDG